MLSMELCFPTIKRGNQEEIETFEATQMSMLCMKCGNYIELACLQDHRALHNALSLFQYDMETKPRNEQALNRQRVSLIKDLNKLLNVSRATYAKEVGKIDLAYEIIKSEMYGRLNKVKPVAYSCDQIAVTIKSFKAKIARNAVLGVCQSANEKWKPVMEDAYSYEAEYMNDANSGFFAVYDGYNGQTAAKKCAEKLHHVLKEKLIKLNASERFCQMGECQLSSGFQETYNAMDDVLLFGEEETSRNRWSGCSAATCMLQGRYLHVANVGNVRGILVKGDHTISQLTEDHTPSNKKERHRIKSNGDVHRWTKTICVNGIGTTTRGLGNHGDPVFKLSIKNTPAFCCVSCNALDKVVLLGSGGFWEVFDEEEVLSLILNFLKRRRSENIDTDRNDDSEDEKKNNPAYSESSVRISIENNATEVQVESLNENLAVRHEVVTLNNESQEVNKEYYGDHATDCEKQCNPCDDSNIGTTYGDIQDPPPGSKAKGCRDNNTENNQLNQVLNFHSSELPHHDGQTHISHLLKDFSDLNSCMLAMEMAKHLVRAALTGGAKDNLTVMVVLLNSS